MARRDDVLGVSGAETIIGAGVVAQGSLESEGDIVIDGTFTGNIQARGDVSLGVNAKVKGDINGRSVVVAGTLKGNVVAEGEAAVRETGHLTGDITCLSLGIDHGGVFIGRSKMQAPPTLDKTAAEEAPPAPKSTEDATE
jgi:cytoskeletal protein CcmA (bactofilin family)